MASNNFTFYKNDGTSTSATVGAGSSVNTIAPYITDVGDSHVNWTRDGYSFIEWNSSSSGSGISYQPGDSISLKNHDTLYAIWEEKPATVYLTTDVELTSIANAIRAKVGTSAPLEYPDGFVSAIENIPSGGENVASNIVYVDYEYTHTETSSATISTWVLNKTAQELLDLLTSGNIVFIKRDGTSSYYQLVGVQRESNGTAGVTYSFPCLNNNPNHLGTYNYVPVLYPGYTVINLTDYPTYTSSIATGGSND